MINIEDCKTIGIHLTALYANGNNVRHFDILALNRFHKKLKKIHR